jgi:hypothetical protein
MSESTYLGHDTTPASDAGLAYLSSLAKLSIIDLRNANVSDAAVKKLKRAAPSLTI